VKSESVPLRIIHLSIGGRLALSFGMVLALLAALGAIALTRAASMRDVFHQGRGTRLENPASETPSQPCRWIMAS